MLECNTYASYSYESVKTIVSFNRHAIPALQGVMPLMAIKVIKDRNQDLTIHEVTGYAIEVEMYDALEKFYQQEPTTMLLWDMSKSDVSHVTPDILQKFIKRSAELGVSRQGGRTAIIAPEDLQYGLARMSMAFSEIESAPFSLCAFRTPKEALQWLKSGDHN